MSDETKRDAADRRSVEAASAKAEQDKSAKARVAKPAEAEKERTPQERLDALAVHVRRHAESAAPISPWIVSEIEALAAAGRGDKGTLIRHEFADPVLLVAAGKPVVAVHTAEEALDYVRSLPVEVRDRLHWQKAERLLLAALDPGGDASALASAGAAFEAALTEDRRLTPLDRKPDERLPDGRVREDRFADRRPPVPQPAADGKAPQPAA